MPRELVLLLGALALLLSALALLLYHRERPGTALVLLFQEATATGLANLRNAYGDEWYLAWLDAFAARLRETNGEPPEAVIDATVEPNRRWILFDVVMVTYVLRDELPQPRRRWSLVRLRRWWCGSPCTVIVTAVADPLARPNV